MALTHTVALVLAMDQGKLHTAEISLSCMKPISWAILFFTKSIPSLYKVSIWLKNKAPVATVSYNSDFSRWKNVSAGLLYASV